MDKQEAKLDRLVAQLDKVQDEPAPRPPRVRDPDPPGLDVRDADLGDDDDEDENVDGESNDSSDEPSLESDSEPDAATAGVRGDPASRRKLFEDDPDAALFQAFGATAEELGVDTADYVQVRRARKRVRDREAKVFAVAEKIEPIALAAQAVASGDYTKLAELIEGITNEPFENVLVKVTRAAGGRAESDKDKTIAELQAKLAAVPAAPDSALVAAVDKELRKNHAVRAIPQWQAAVAKVLEETADADGDPTLTVAQAADAVYKDYEKEVADRAARLQPKISDTRPRARAASGAKKRKMTLEDLMADLDKERD